MKTTIRRNRVAALVVVLMAFAVWSGGTSARIQLTEHLEISGEVFVLSELNFASDSGSGPAKFNLATPVPGLFLDPAALGTPSNGDRHDTLTAFRTEILVEVVYTGIPHITPVVKLRPYYDFMFDINDKDNSIDKFWQTNFSKGLHDEYDPILREAFIDFSYHPVNVRAGRQIVTWGRSDGVTVLDVVTPRNFRNPLTFEQERFMIPQWMINFKVDLSRFDWLPGGSVSKELQIVWNLDYRPSRFPGFKPKEEGQHPWTLGVVDFANQIIRVSEGLFEGPAGSGAPDLPGTFFNDDEWDRGDTWNQSEIFVRWKGRTGSDVSFLSDMTYSIHYAYLYEDIPFYELQGRADFGFAFPIATARAAGGGIDFEKHRYQLAGLSFDKALMFLPGQFQGTVLRGEVAYNIGNKVYEPDFALRVANSVQTLVGLDQYLYIGPTTFIKTPWFTSFQFWHDEILRDPGPGRFTKLGTPECAAQPGCGRDGYIIGGETNMFNGLRNRARNVITLFMFNEFLPGKTLRVELFGLHEFSDRQRSTWLRGVLGYVWNSRMSSRVGINFVTGERDAFFGEFEQNSSVFMEMKFTF